MAEEEGIVELEPQTEKTSDDEFDDPEFEFENLSKVIENLPDIKNYLKIHNTFEHFKNEYEDSKFIPLDYDEEENIINRLKVQRFQMVGSPDQDNMTIAETFQLSQNDFINLGFGGTSVGEESLKFATMYFALTEVSKHESKLWLFLDYTIFRAITTDSDIMSPVEYARKYHKETGGGINLTRKFQSDFLNWLKTNENFEGVFKSPLKTFDDRIITEQMQFTILEKIGTWVVKYQTDLENKSIINLKENEEFLFTPETVAGFWDKHFGENVTLWWFSKGYIPDKPSSIERENPPKNIIEIFTAGKEKDFYPKPVSVPPKLFYADKMSLRKPPPKPRADVVQPKKFIGSVTEIAKIKKPSFEEVVALRKPKPLVPEVIIITKPAKIFKPLSTMEKLNLRKPSGKTLEKSLKQREEEELERVLRESEITEKLEIDERKKKMKESPLFNLFEFKENKIEEVPILKPFEFKHEKDLKDWIVFRRIPAVILFQPEKKFMQFLVNTDFVNISTRVRAGFKEFKDLEKLAKNIKQLNVNIKIIIEDNFNNYSLYSLTFSSHLILGIENLIAYCRSIFSDSFELLTKREDLAVLDLVQELNIEKLKKIIKIWQTPKNKISKNLFDSLFKPEENRYKLVREFIETPIISQFVDNQFTIIPFYKGIIPFLSQVQYNLPLFDYTILFTEQIIFSHPEHAKEVLDIFSKISISPFIKVLKLFIWLARHLNYEIYSNLLTSDIVNIDWFSDEFFKTFKPYRDYELDRNLGGGFVQIMNFPLTFIDILDKNNNLIFWNDLLYTDEIIDAQPIYGMFKLVGDYIAYSPKYYKLREETSNYDEVVVPKILNFWNNIIPDMNHDGDSPIFNNKSNPEIWFPNLFTQITDSLRIGTDYWNKPKNKKDSIEEWGTVMDKIISLGPGSSTNGNIIENITNRLFSGLTQPLQKLDIGMKLQNFIQVNLENVEIKELVERFEKVLSHREFIGRLVRIRIILRDTIDSLDEKLDIQRMEEMEHFLSQINFLNWIYSFWNEFSKYISTWGTSAIIYDKNSFLSHDIAGANVVFLFLLFAKNDLHFLKDIPKSRDVDTSFDVVVGSYINRMRDMKFFEEVGAEKLRNLFNMNSLSKKKDFTELESLPSVLFPILTKWFDFGKWNYLFEESSTVKFSRSKENPVDDEFFNLLEEEFSFSKEEEKSNGIDKTYYAFSSSSSEEEHSGKGEDEEKIYDESLSMGESFKRGGGGETIVSSDSEGSEEFKWDEWS